jgi:hypothetical protein
MRWEVDVVWSWGGRVNRDMGESQGGVEGRRRAWEDERTGERERWSRMRGFHAQEGCARALSAQLIPTPSKPYYQPPFPPPTTSSRLLKLTKREPILSLSTFRLPTPLDDVWMNRGELDRVAG